MEITSISKYGYTLLKFHPNDTGRNGYNFIWGKEGKICAIGLVNGMPDFPWFDDEEHALETLERCITTKAKYNFEFSDKIEKILE